MARFAVAYVNFFDNDLTTEIIEAPNAFAAAVIRVQNEGFEIDRPDVDSLLKLKQFAFDCDTLIDAIAID